MDNSTATPLQGTVLLANQLELVTPTTVAGTLYGIAFTLFCLYVHSLAPQLWDNGDRKTQAKFMLGYSTVIMLCGLYFLVSNAWAIQNAYIKHPDTPGGPILYTESTIHTPMMVILFTSDIVIDVLTLAIQIWRVWVVWSATRYAILAIVLPVLCFLAFLALRLRSIILQSTLSIAESVRQDSKTETGAVAVQIATTVFCTVFISLYLIFKQWQQRKLIGKAQGATGYMSVVAMLIESYALESTWLVVMAILQNRSVLYFFAESSIYIEIIAYLLLQYRVANGRAVKSQRERNNISSLHWNRSNHATTQFGETDDDEIHNGPRVSAIPEVSDIPRVSSMA